MGETVSVVDFRQGFMRRFPLLIAAAFLAANLVVVGSTGVAEAGGSSAATTLQVLGSPIGNITTSPLSLTPTFAQQTTDYVLRCHVGVNSIQLTVSAASARRIMVGTKRGSSVTFEVNLVENQALILRGPGHTTEYWIRCLPHDFPQLSVTKSGNVPPGWYVTGNLSSANGSGWYAMVLDDNGTPVWYRRSSGSNAADVTPLSDHTIAWMPNTGGGFGSDPLGAFEVYDLSTGTTSFLAAPIAPTDFHELHQMSNGDLMMLSTPLKAHVDLTALGFSSSETIVDCVIQEVDQAGRLKWQWRASDHISPSESTHPTGNTIVLGQQAFDIYHCNSVDADPVTGNVLLSTRHTDAVYYIDKTTGKVVWKMGGTSANHDNAQILTITEDPDGAFHAQHDARFQPNGDVSLYDNQTWDSSLAARGVEYHIDTAAGTAALVWSYTAADGLNSGFTGSFERRNGGTDNVIAWGGKKNALFTEVDANGKVSMNVTFPNNEVAYRVIKVNESALNLHLLRSTAGLAPFVLTHRPALTSIAPAGGSAGGGAAVRILGTGFSGATSVAFGSNLATDVVVSGDGSITATSPAGAGSVVVSVRGPGGTSDAATANQLATSNSDSTFEYGTGTWHSNLNSNLAISSTFARSGTYSLEVRPQSPGFDSVASGMYPVLPSASVTGSAWVITPTQTDPVRAFLIFYDSSGTLLQISPAPSFQTSSMGTWTELSVSALAPLLAASMIIGVDDQAGLSPMYLDDATLTGSDLFSYQ